MSDGDWERCKPWIEASIKASPLADGIETIQKKLANGTYRLESSPNAACIVEYADFDGHKALMIRFGGGNLDELLNTIEPKLASEARSSGRIILAEGRLGWLKPAQVRGYKLAWITMVKE